MTGDVDVLLVEDSEVDAELIREALKDLGLPHSVQTAQDGMEALDILWTRPERPHFIILDLNLPKMSGLDVLREIKRDPELRVIPVLMLTNSSAQEDVIQCYGHFANAYIRKPIGYDQLLATLRITWEFWTERVLLPRRDEDLPALSDPPPSVEE